MIPTPEEAAEALWRLYWESRRLDGLKQELIAFIRERDRAILDEAERDCWNLPALRRKLLGEQRTSAQTGGLAE